MCSTLSPAQLFDAQTLRELLALMQTCRGCSLRCAFLCKTWDTLAMENFMWPTCVRSPPTKYCSRVTLRVMKLCTPCSCTTHSSSHTNLLIAHTERTCTLCLEIIVAFNFKQIGSVLQCYKYIHI